MGMRFFAFVAAGLLCGSALAQPSSAGETTPRDSVDTSQPPVTGDRRTPSDAGEAAPPQKARDSSQEVPPASQEAQEPVEADPRKPPRKPDPAGGRQDIEDAEDATPGSNDGTANAPLPPASAPDTPETTNAGPPPAAASPATDPHTAADSTPATPTTPTSARTEKDGTDTGLDAETLATPVRPDEHPLVAIDDELFLGVAAIGGWGISRWKWFTRSFHFKNEYGFSRRSSTGGADKTGHFFAGYVVGDLLAWRLRSQGFERTEAALWGAAGSMALMTWIEIGDATSRFGWSFEDLLADALGVGVSALLGSVPVLDDLFDFRVQYWPTDGFLSGESRDLVADYSGMKHLVALKLSGVPYVRNTPLRFLEAQFGFYSRGFRKFDEEDPLRVMYFGIGLTATELLKPVLPKIPGVRHWSPGILTFFEYYQPPFLAAEAATAEFE